MDCWVKLVQHPVWLQVRVSWKGNMAWRGTAEGKQGALVRASTQPGVLKNGFLRGFLQFLFCSDARALSPHALLPTSRMKISLGPLCCPLSGWDQRTDRELTET